MQSIHQLLGGSYLLRALGLPVDNVIQGLEDFHDQFYQLQGLQDTFSLCAGMMGANMLANLLQNGGIPGAMFMPPPNQGSCGCGGQYAPSVGFDFGAAPGQSPFSLGSLMQRQRGGMFEQFLQQNPFARAQVEMMLGGRILPDGLPDGRIRVQPFSAGGIPGGANPAAMSALGVLDQLSRAAMATGMPQAFGPGMFQSMMLGALNNVLNQGGGGNNRGFDLFNPGDFLGDGGAPFQRGVNSPTQGAFGIEPENGDASGILNDSSLTVEDKVCLMIMLIMKKMDKDIEKMANYINQLQQQQNGGGGGKGGGKGGKGGGGGGSSPSIDVETMKLKRLIDKRSQMFDMLRQIIDKYNQTAKGIIDSMGR